MNLRSRGGRKIFLRHSDGMNVYDLNAHLVTKIVVIMLIIEEQSVSTKYVIADLHRSVFWNFSI